MVHIVQRLKDTLHYVSSSSSSQPVLCRIIQSSDIPCVKIAHEIILRYLRHDPSSLTDILPSILASLNSPDYTVAMTAIPYVSEIVLLSSGEWVQGEWVNDWYNNCLHYSSSSSSVSLIRRGGISADVLLVSVCSGISCELWSGIKTTFVVPHVTHCSLVKIIFCHNAHRFSVWWLGFIPVAVIWDFYKELRLSNEHRKPFILLLEVCLSSGINILSGKRFIMRWNTILFLTLTRSLPGGDGWRS